MSCRQIGRLGLVVGCVAILAGSASAQRPGGGRRNPAMMVRMMLPLEQTLGYLAFDGDMGLTDAQLVAVRSALKPVDKERARLAGEMGGDVDRQQMMASVGKLRADMFARIKEVLDDRQDALLDTYLERMRQRMQRGGQRGGGRDQFRRGGE